MAYTWRSSLCYRLSGTSCAQASESATEPPNLTGLDFLYQSIIGSSMPMSNGLPDLSALPISVLGPPSSTQSQPPMHLGSEPLPTGSHALPTSHPVAACSPMTMLQDSGEGSAKPIDPRARKGDPRLPAQSQATGAPQAESTAPGAPTSAPPFNPRDPRAKRSQQGAAGLPPPPPLAPPQPTGLQSAGSGSNDFPAAAMREPSPAQAASGPQPSGAPATTASFGLPNMQVWGGAYPGTDQMGAPQLQQQQGGMSASPFPAGLPSQAPVPSMQGTVQR